MIYSLFVTNLIEALLGFSDLDFGGSLSSHHGHGDVACVILETLPGRLFRGNHFHH